MRGAGGVGSPAQLVDGGGETGGDLVEPRTRAPRTAPSDSSIRSAISERPYCSAATDAVPSIRARSVSSSGAIVSVRCASSTTSCLSSLMQPRLGELAERRLEDVDTPEQGSDTRRDLLLPLSVLRVPLEGEHALLERSPRSPQLLELRGRVPVELRGVDVGGPTGEGRRDRAGVSPLLRERAGELEPRDRSGFDEDLAQRLARLALDRDRFVELRVRDERAGEEDLADRATGGCRGDHCGWRLPASSMTGFPRAWREAVCPRAGCASPSWCRRTVREPQVCPHSAYRIASDRSRHSIQRHSTGVARSSVCGGGSATPPSSARSGYSDAGPDRSR